MRRSATSKLQQRIRHVRSTYEHATSGMLINTKERNANGAFDVGVHIVIREEWSQRYRELLDDTTLRIFIWSRLGLGQELSPSASHEVVDDLIHGRVLRDADGVMSEYCVKAAALAKQPHRAMTERETFSLVSKLTDATVDYRIASGLGDSIAAACALAQCVSAGVEAYLLLRRYWLPRPHLRLRFIANVDPAFYSLASNLLQDQSEDQRLDTLERFCNDAVCSWRNADQSWAASRISDYESGAIRVNILGREILIPCPRR
jgi:hypothetical protein